MASVKQLAAELGVNKATIFRKMDELGLREDHTTNDGPRGALDVDAYACSAIADALGRGEQKPVSQPSQPNDKVDGESAAAALATVVEVLRDQLRAAEERERRAAEDHKIELAEKNRQIEDLQAQLREANDRLDAARSRSWFDRLLGRGLPAPRQTG